MIGILITTVGILLLVLGIVGASIEVYGRLLSAMVQQQVSAITQQLPAILQPEEADIAEESGSPFDSTDILGSLVENLVNTPLWLALAVAGIVLIYFGLYVAQRQRFRH
jgi:predicted PurR-regulated permease PerM